MNTSPTPFENNNLQSTHPFHDYFKRSTRWGKVPEIIEIKDQDYYYYYYYLEHAVCEKLFYRILKPPITHQQNHPNSELIYKQIYYTLQHPSSEV